MILPRIQDSPVPIKTMSGFDSDTATAPTEELVIWPSVTGDQSIPPLTVFHKPPPTAPKYASLRRPLTPVTAMERPPRAGPMLRHLYVPKNELSAVSGACGHAAGTKKPKTIVKRRRRVLIECA